MSMEEQAALWGALAFLAIAIAVVLLGWKTDLLRDAEPADFAGAKPPVGRYRRPFSLAQTQMAWWFCIVTGCFVFLWITHGWKHDNILTAQSLILLGIGTGTALGATMIQQVKSDQLTVLNQFKTAAAAIAALPAGTPIPADLLATRDRLAARLASEDFFKDILTDADGISLHRFQSFAWTIVLGIVFIVEVLINPMGSMPTFDATLLALLGISGGTYLGFKIPEQPA